ncbi:DUF1232 domain-containing protein [Opitutus terrae]|uniref:DUF1232 domain-containing protein n=1 Tax=Opitutus terrae (strain DSM 11246 / JCM 15787 / PB90-1) TaxID=452637 RepID=B1ZS46_OPITP|nr:YkvA family protein [Opitutus terrae]ACB74722.1 hypothetical protein Oter_1437 [Opitutus terrae PB90-1]
MNPPSIQIPEALNQHLSANASDDLPSTASYVDRGAELITPEAIRALMQLRPQLQAKIDAINDSELLRQRLELLATYFDDTCDAGPTDPQLQHEVAFALLYFLKGFDRIPDTVPEIGLLDDAMIVQTVLQRHSTGLQAHWLRNRRVWPAAAAGQ